MKLPVLDAVTVGCLEKIIEEESEILHLATAMAQQDDPDQRSFTLSMIFEGGLRIAGHWSTMENHKGEDLGSE